MEKYDGLHKVYRDAKSVQAAKSAFADEFEVPYDECVAKKVYWANNVVAVIHNG